MIDTHIHVVPPDLPGVGALGLRPEGGAAEVASLLRQEMEARELFTHLSMGFHFLMAEVLTPNSTAPLLAHNTTRRAVGRWILTESLVSMWRSASCQKRVHFVPTSAGWSFSCYCSR